MSKARCVSERLVRLGCVIGTMNEGEYGYAMPRAFNPVTEQVTMEYIAEPEPRGTATMKIKCIKRRELYRAWPVEDIPIVAGDGIAPCIPAKYPQKQCLVKFEKFLSRSFHIWTDLSVFQVYQVPGVAEVSKSSHGKYYVYFDPRYNPEDVQAEIERRAIEHEACR